MTRKLHRGQVAAEFMLYSTVFMLVAIAAFLVVSALQSNEIPLQQNTVAREVGEGFVTILTLSVKGGEGFSYNYTFQETVFNRPYRLYLTNLTEGNFMVLEWEGDYGNFSYSYAVPDYEYKLEGCVQDQILVSNDAGCLNMLIFENDGENLTIIQKVGS